MAAKIKTKAKRHSSPRAKTRMPLSTRQHKALEFINACGPYELRSTPGRVGTGTLAALHDRGLIRIIVDILPAGVKRVAT